MKVNFKELVVINIDGGVIKDIDKVVANTMYTLTKDISLVQIALDINKGIEVELTGSQVDEIKRLIEDEKAGYYAFVRKAILDFLSKQ